MSKLFQLLKRPARTVGKLQPDWREMRGDKAAAFVGKNGPEHNQCSRTQTGSKRPTFRERNQWVSFNAWRNAVDWRSCGSQASRQRQPLVLACGLRFHALGRHVLDDFGCCACAKRILS